MLFNSLEFAAFIALFFPLYWAVKGKVQLQNVLVLVASYVFYGWWDWRFLCLIAASSLVDFGVGLALGNADTTRSRKAWLAVSVLFNLGVLCTFKYFDFFADNMALLLGKMGFAADAVTLDLVLPVGISFYTFQTLSYTIDVYRKTLEPARDPVAFFAYVAFFPQLVAGPIERATRLLPQFARARKFDLTLAKDGLRQILWGLFAKVVIADNCAPMVNELFGTDLSYHGGTTLVLGAVLFAFQIYGDFAGYSNIALGVSKLLGFELMVNFRTPYFSRDIAEFWRRWHISLSTWFRDYVYIPLGGSRGGRSMAVRNIFIIFLVSGFWHGANWTFVVWGGLNALFFVPLFLRGRNRRYTEHIAEGRKWPTVREGFAMLSTFALTCVAWVFFRAKTVGEAWDYLVTLVVQMPQTPAAVAEKLLRPISIFIVALLVLEWINRSRDHGLDVARWPVWARWATYYLLVFSIFFFGNYQDPIDFIYFQF